MFSSFDDLNEELAVPDENMTDKIPKASLKSLFLKKWWFNKGI